MSQGNPPVPIPPNQTILEEGVVPAQNTWPPEIPKGQNQGGGGGGGGTPHGPPKTLAFFDAAGNLTGMATFASVDPVLGAIYVGQAASDHGSASHFQLSSIVANATQYRNNQYGNNSGAPGMSSFKSRAAAVGALAGVLPGDPLQRFVAVGVAPDNASIPLASFITIQVPLAFVPAGQNWVPSELELQLVPLAGPINSRRVVFKVSSEGETQTLRGVRAGGPTTAPANLATGTLWSSGNGAPNGVITGSPGDLYSNTAGGAGATFWVKESGVNTNTGWVAK